MSPRLLAIPALLLAFAGVSAADEQPVRLEEKFQPGTIYRVRSHMTGTATLTLPKEKDTKEGQSLTGTAESSIDYDERILEIDSGGLPNKTLRHYKTIDFRKVNGKQKIENTLRPAVRRLVVLRDKNLKVPFSPDGPLLVSEIDLIRTDVFAPSLRGLLPDKPVKPGDAWKASSEAVRELTDMTVEEGSIECKLHELGKINGRRAAEIGISGSVRGVGEDGPTRHEINGRFYFDMEANYISYISFQGKQLLLDKDKPAGTIEGIFTLVRVARIQSADLADDAIRGVKLNPDDDNTLLLYDNEDLGVRFQYPRRWKVAGVNGRQIMIDADDDNGLLLTLDAIAKIPTAAQFTKESETFIREQKGRILGTTTPRRLQASPAEIDQFAIDAVMKDKRLLLDYYIIRQKDSGATLAAHLTPEAMKSLRPEVERIVKSVVVGK